jgi:heme exporter protein A
MGFASFVGSAYVAQMAGPGQSFPGIVLEKAGCARGGRVLFEGLNQSMGAGDALVVTGPNGVGKSSLLRMIAGLLPLSGGQMRVEGRIALADEAVALDPEKPLLAALRFWAKLDGGDAAQALREMGLDHLADVPVRMLSTGQRRRASLARVLASSADIWLLDEPANGLDADSLDRLLAAIATHRSNSGIVIAASHLPLGLSQARELELT